MENMTYVGGLDGRGESHYRVMKVLLYLFLAFMIYKIVAGVGTLVYFGVAAPENIQIEETDSSYRVELPMGFLQMYKAEFPQMDALPEAKRFVWSFSLVVLLAFELPGLLLLFVLLGIIREINGSHSPFTSRVARNIRWCGLLCLYFGLASKLLYQLVIGAFVFERFPYFQNPIQWIAVFAGVLLLFVSDIFRKGCALQQESDETL